ncbi:MAG: hypothetical protein K0V04_42400 [Deltaproteobacteria bacterium]|nr:hypothetical protein [Deltaproteobacteria bacterium]
MSAVLAMLADKPQIDISGHAELVTTLILAVLGLLIAFFVVRPELWRRIFFQRVDPRPAALMRIVFGVVVLWTFVDLLKPHGPLEDTVARYLFTDDGLWLNDMARKNYGGQLKTLWDPEHGFEHWYDIFKAMWGKFSVLHFRSDPPFVFTLYGVMIASLLMMIMGLWTRWTTIISWILVESIYRYSPVYYTGGDTVVRVFLFLGMFSQWGQAYSLDSWRRHRKAILGKATEIPALRKIAAWPLRLMMLQLGIIYCATGLLKSGATWANGTALYYSLNLDHFYRWPQMGLIGAVHYIGILPLLTILVHWWEMLFPLALVGAVTNAYERERAAGTWVRAAVWRRWLSYLLFFAAWGIGAYIAGVAAHYYAPQRMLDELGISRPAAVRLAMGIAATVPLLAVALYLGLRAKAPRVHRFIRHWLLGKRFWLVIGTGMHIGIDLGMNVGTFANVMVAVYFAWLSGDEIDAFWRYLATRRLAPGEGARPIRRQRWKRVLLTPLDVLRHRVRKDPLVVLHNPGDSSVRRAALLRVWDLSGRLEMKADPDVSPEQLLLVRPGHNESLSGHQAGHALIRVLPGLWWMRGLRHIPGVSTIFGTLAMMILRQR